jgi:hypothetical protein
MELTVITSFIYFKLHLIISVGCYSLDIESFQFCSALNPDHSICMDCHYSTWLFAVWASCFAEVIVLFHHNLIANLVIIMDTCTVFAGCVKIGLGLPIVSKFVPVGYERDVEEHDASEYCHTWRGFKDCVVGRTNGPCCVVEKD